LTLADARLQSVHSSIDYSVEVYYRMTHRRKGQLTGIAERVKHLRKFMKRHFWKSERQAEKKEIKGELSTHRNQ
jgi:hypothetical protein